jgi:uncharacterized protein with NRDE domain
VCLIAFAINASARWPLVIAANRDEYLDRPSLPLARWTSASGQEIISGRDLHAGGTWLGMTSGGRMAFLTNVREGRPQAAPRSRGELVMRWLETNCEAGDFVREMEKDGSAYGGFNLVLGDFQRDAWTWVTNKAAALPAMATSRWHAQPLQAGVYGLSNAALDTPWPKTIELKQTLATALAASPDEHQPEALLAPLWAALGNRQRAPLASLPATGVPLPIEEALSSAFVDFPENAYGTRSSTVLFASAADHGKGNSKGERRWDLQVEERTHARADAQAATHASRHPAGHSLASSYRMTWLHAGI